MDVALPPTLPQQRGMITWSELEHSSEVPGDSTVHATHREPAGRVNMDELGVGRTAEQEM